MSNNVFWGVHTALNKGASPTVLMVGDSWFWYPINNLANEVGSLFSDETFVVIGKNGAEAADWSQGTRKAIDFGFDMFARGSKALMLYLLRGIRYGAVQGIGKTWVFDIFSV